MTEQPLAGFIEAWRTSCADVAALLRSLDVKDWERQTDLPGWNVRYCAAHLAHLESALAGMEQPKAEVPDLPHVNGMMGQFTEEGPLARATWSNEQIVAEFEEAVATRLRELTQNPPTDPTAPGPGFAGLIGWSWETLLSNRPFDVWMHEQDIRRAVGREGNLDTLGARHAAAVLTKSFSFVVGKKAKAPEGSTVVLETTGPVQTVMAATVADGRGKALTTVPDDPTVRIGLDFEDWIVLSGGRRTAEQVRSTIEGDTALGETVLANLAVTP